MLLGIFHGVPATKKSVFDLSVGPAHIVLYQKNIEAICSTETEVRQQIRQTLMHELGHYFGMTEQDYVHSLADFVRSRSCANATRGSRCVRPISLRCYSRSAAAHRVGTVKIVISLVGSIGEVDEVAPASVGLTTSHFNTGARG